MLGRRQVSWPAGRDPRDDGRVLQGRRIPPAAIELLTALSAESPGPAVSAESPSQDKDNYRRDLLRSQLGLGVLYRKLHRFQEAEEQLQAAGTNSEPLTSSTAEFDRQLLAELAYQKGGSGHGRPRLAGPWRPVSSNGPGRASRPTGKRDVSRKCWSRNNPVVPICGQSWAAIETTWASSWTPQAGRISPR